ncbi:uncharacterized protein LODBEIA_P01190 [Lodderomyces beijingensis]|uniref:DUF676 domain-containing protein n=1 Tax=Lodderomyces beijingensis TaxID=1775926 RepID=A0ABP0ZHR2_9ASCO
MVDYHLVILVHGIWGNSSHLAYIEKQLNEHIKPTDGSKLLVHKTGSHSGYLTYDGIDVNGKRICDEIREEVQMVQNEGNRVTKFSIVGYSLGGLISRYAIGILYSQGFFKEVEPINFVTFCTPHIGVSNPQTHNLSVRIYNKTAPFFLLTTGSQFFLRDHVGTHKKPLIAWMADPNSQFYAALKSFKYRSLYANVVNDKRCSWFTASITPGDPLNSMYNKSPKNIICEYIKGYEPNVIDYTKPLHYEKKDGDEPASKPRFSGFWKTLNWLRIIGNVIVHTPFWALSFVITSIVEKIKSMSRLRKFNSQLSNRLSHLHEYHEDTSLLTDFSNKLEDDQDNLVEDVYGAMNWKVEHSAKFPKIKLDANQSFAVEKLNTLGWKKYPVILRHTPATHAGAIVRHADPNFDEGKVVVRHFINEVFKLE